MHPRAICGNGHFVVTGAVQRESASKQGMSAIFLSQLPLLPHLPLLMLLPYLLPGALRIQELLLPYGLCMT